MGRVVASPACGTSRDRRRGEHGQTLVEIGFLLPIFLVLIIGVIEVTNAMNAYVTVVSTARDGARLGSKGLATDDEIKNLVLVETERLRNPVDPATDVTVTHDQVDGVNAITVEVCNDYEPLLDVPLVVPDTLRMCSSTAMRKFPTTN
jgi:Flp pilus assembly protein TadG